jgi:hypothetical protein
MSEEQDVYSGYSTTTKVRDKAGVGDQDDIKNRAINDAIKATEIFINRACQKPDPLTNLSSPIPSDLQMACTLIAASVIVQELKDEDKDYSDLLNLGMMFLSNFTKTDVTILMQLWGFMYVSTANTRPANPDADPFISLNQAW